MTDPLPTLSISISLADLLHGRSVESERLEIKAGWNPESVMHSVDDVLYDEPKAFSAGTQIAGLGYSGRGTAVGLEIPQRSHLAQVDPYATHTRATSRHAGGGTTDHR